MSIVDDKMSQSAAMPPVSVTVVDDGTHVPKGTVATTPSHMPNLVVNVVPPLVALAIRFGNVFGTCVLGLMSAPVVSDKAADLLGAGDFMGLLYNCAMMAVAPACLDLLKNIVTIFGRLEGKYPLLTGSV